MLHPQADHDGEMGIESLPEIRGASKVRIIERGLGMPTDVEADFRGLSLTLLS